MEARSPNVNESLLAWPASRLGEAMSALARRSGLDPRQVNPPSFDPGRDKADLNIWISSTARYLGIEVKPVSCRYPELEKLLRSSGPSLIRLPGDEEPRFFLLLRASSRRVHLLANDLTTCAISLEAVQWALGQELERPVKQSVEHLLDRAGISGKRRDKAISTMVSERLATSVIGDCWLLRLPPSVPFSRLARQARLPRYLAAFSGLHIIDYLLWIFSWYLIGRGALEGRLDWGWLAGWALILLTLTPLRMLKGWYQALLAVGTGALVKQRLLQGALQLEPDEVRHQGTGHHLGRVIESEAVERLALAGGFLTLVAGLELIIATLILPRGAGGLFQVLLFVAWLALVLLLARRYYEQRRTWAELRLGISHDLIEKMVGYRTRLAQQRPEHWHEGEDETLARYLDLSVQMDRSAALLAAVPRGWMIVGLLGLAPAFVSGQVTLVRLAVGLGAVILVYRSLVKLVDGLTALTDAAIAWRKVAALFHTAAREDIPGDPTVELALSSAASSQQPPVGETAPPMLEATSLVFRYPDRGEPVLRGCSFRIQAGDRVLLESPSGGGKSTLVSLLNALRSPDSGLLLIHGLDRQSLGKEGWTRRVATAPQFHENHVITETFAFNLLMARRWPPHPEDLDEAEELCHELGLGELLDRMPAGMLQMVGDTGWQLSHGEKSRLFLARALLQGAELVVLDESFAALDPANLRQALHCAQERAPTLMVIAHP
jgi:ATP-binding cassette subfamily B protein